MIIAVVFVLTLLQTPTEPVRAHCSLEEDGKIVCVSDTADENGDGKPYLLTKQVRRAFDSTIKELQPGLSTFDLEDDGKQVCLVSVNVMGGWTKEPVNRKPECVSRLPEKKR